MARREEQLITNSTGSERCDLEIISSIYECESRIARDLKRSAQLFPFQEVLAFAGPSCAQAIQS